MAALPDLLLPKIKFFGLSIERNALHAIELTKSGKNPKLAEVRLPPNTFVDGVISDVQTFVAAVKSLIAAARISTPYVAVTFPEVFAYTRGVNIPAVPLSEMQEAVSWQVRDLFPFPSEEIYFDWRLMGKTGSEYRVSIIAVQKKVLDPLVDALVSAGLKPLRFEPDASAVARLLTVKPQGHAILVEINPHGAYITLVEGEKALFTTVVPYTKEDTPESYLANIDQTLTEVSVFYQNKGIIAPENTAVYITGDMASEDWVRHVHELLKYPASLLTTTLQRAFNKAYAAASFEIKPPSDEQSINVLPHARQMQYDRERTEQFYRIVFGRTAVMLALVTISSGIAFGAVSVLRRRLENMIKTEQSRQTAEAANSQEILALNAYAKNIIALSPLRKTSQDSLRKIGGLLNDKITVTSWEYDDSRMQYKIVGSAATRDDLLDLKTSLEQSDSFAKVTLPLGTLETPVNVPFVLTFVLKS